MKRGFMDWAVVIIENTPGLTAREIAREALACDSDLSDAKNPIESLTNTLNKQVQTGREKRIRRERIGGLYRYFPEKALSPTSKNEVIVVQMSLSTQHLEDIDNLGAVDKFNNRSEAIKWLITEGVTANRGYLDKVADTRNQIERLKREIVAV